MDRAAIVIGGAAQIIQVEDSHLAPCLRDVGIRDARGKTADAIMGRWRRGGVINVNKPVGGKIRIESDAQKSTLAECGGGDRGKRSREQGSAADHAQGSCLLADKEPAIRGERHRRGIGQPGRNLDLRKTGREELPRAAKRRPEEERTRRLRSVARGGLEKSCGLVLVCCVIGKGRSLISSPEHPRHRSKIFLKREHFLHRFPPSPARPFRRAGNPKSQSPTPQINPNPKSSKLTKPRCFTHFSPFDDLKFS